MDYNEKLFSEHPSWVWDGIIAKNTEDNRTDINEHVARLTSIDMMLMSQCDMFVGKFTSNFFRTAYELKAAECDCAPPFTSLDAPWCFDYGLLEGRNWNYPARDNATELLERGGNRLQC